MQEYYLWRYFQKNNKKNMSVLCMKKAAALLWISGYYLSCLCGYTLNMECAKKTLL